MEFETRISWVEDLGGNLVRVEVKPEVELELSDLDELLQVYEQVLGAEKGRFLVVFNEGGKSNQETREKFASSSRSQMKIAEALVVKNLPQRIESNFYKNYFKLGHPIQVFDNEKEAIKWLRSFE